MARTEGAKVGLVNAAASLDNPHRNEYDLQMAGNIILFLGASFFLWLVQRFGPNPEWPRQHRLYLTIFALFCSVLLLFNALLAYLIYDSLYITANLPPTTSPTQLDELPQGDPVNVVGTISPNNPILVENYVAYYDCIDTTCYPDLPPQLLIHVEDGEIVISNNSYEDHSWPEEANVYYLAPEQPVVVAGTVVHSADEVTVEGAIVFAGSYDLFVRLAQNQQIVPLILMGANLFAAAAGLFITFSLFRFMTRPING